MILIAIFMGLFDFSAVNIAAPPLQHELHTTESALELIVAGYAFTYASGMVTGGRLGDLFGYRRLFLVGMVAFTIASLLCGVAQSPMQLVGARLLQGATAAIMVPQVLALITAAFPPAERTRALGWFGMTMGIGSVAGQVLGGVLINANLFGWGWRNIFLVNVPVGLLALTFALRTLPRTPLAARRLDPVGALGIPVGLALLLVPLVLGRTQGWPTWTWISMAASVPTLTAVIAWERKLGDRGEEPVLDVTLFRTRPFVIGLLTNVAFLGFWGSYFFVLTLVVQSGLGLTALAAGMAFMPMGVVFGVTSILARPLVARYGARMITLGAAISALALLATIVVVRVEGNTIGIWALIPEMVMLGLGTGLAFPALVGSVLAEVPRRAAGAAAGSLSTAQQFASAAGVAVIGSVFFATFGSHQGHPEISNALTTVTVIHLVLMLVVTGLSILLVRRPNKRMLAPNP
ncbi:MFS transporter [Micromonospora pisi]|uniref:MFS transporter n=1 Tax=Micromonospora pisi TaxID=589240 RepID=UPI001B872A9E|nr:MFS transporter [Micromonospora pisi]